MVFWTNGTSCKGAAAASRRGAPEGGDTQLRTGGVLGRNANALLRIPGGEYRLCVARANALVAAPLGRRRLQWGGDVGELSDSHFAYRPDVTASVSAWAEGDHRWGGIVGDGSDALSTNDPAAGLWWLWVLLALLLLCCLYLICLWCCLLRHRKAPQDEEVEIKVEQIEIQSELVELEEEEESSEWGDIEIERQVITAEMVHLDEASAEEQLRLSHLEWGSSAEVIPAPPPKSASKGW